MREIKFRGKRKDNSEWVYGYYTQGIDIKNNKTVPIIACNFKPKEHTYNGYEIIPETLGQFTGLKDKDGKDIYEGDVVKDIYDSIFAITFGTFTDTKSHDQVGFYKTYFSIDEDLNVCDGTMDDVDKTCEVIGNIHEGVME